MTTYAASNAKLGYDDYACIPDDGLRHEIVDGEHVVNPAPNLRHQQVLGNLYSLLRAALIPANRADVLLSPVDVQLSDHDIVQPDLVVVLASRRSILIPSRVLGVPDLLVEILTPSSVAYDRVRKKALYERAGVPEFWLVDPELRTLEQFVLEAGKYQLIPAADVVELSVARGVTVRLADVW